MLITFRNSKRNMSDLSNQPVKRVNVQLALHHTFLAFKDTEEQKAFENPVGKGRNAGDQHFLLFPQCFPMNQ